MLDVISEVKSVEVAALKCVAFLFYRGGLVVPLGFSFFSVCCVTFCCSYMIQCGDLRLRVCGHVETHQRQTIGGTKETRNKDLKVFQHQNPHIGAAICHTAKNLTKKFWSNF